MLLWHVAGTVAIARYAFRDERMDLRFLMLGAVLPDLIDTPIGLLFFGRFGGVRLAAHSLLAASILMASIVLATRRGRPRKKWMGLAIGMLIHMFLDAMWASPETLWWPLFGFEFSPSGATDVAQYMSEVLANGLVWLGEAVGLIYLLVLARRARLKTADARALFLATGRVDVPIGGR